MIVCVIMLHAAMTYMIFVPEWWYVIDNSKSIYFTMLVVLLDSFPMSVLFYLAGYFAVPSLNKYKVKNFIKNKFTRIFLPWLLGRIFVVPFFAYATFKAFKLPDPGFLLFIKNYFLTVKFHGSFYQQAHYWFLSVLFAFLILYALFAGKINLIKIKIWQVILITFVSYFVSAKFLMPPDDWLNILGVIYFQPARVLGYAALFMLGVRAYNDKDFKINLKLYGPLSLVFAIALIAFKFNFNFNNNFNLIIDAACYSIFSVIFAVTSTNLFAKIKQAPQTLIKLSQSSYGIYWLHQIILMPVLYLLKDLDLNIFCKWLAGVLGTVLIAYLINNFIFRKLPVLNKIF